MGCEWLAGLVWEGLGGLGMGCDSLVNQTTPSTTLDVASASCKGSGLVHETRVAKVLHKIV